MGEAVRLNILLLLSLYLVTVFHITAAGDRLIPVPSVLLVLLVPQ